MYCIKHIKVQKKTGNKVTELLVDGWTIFADEINEDILGGYKTGTLSDFQAQV